MDILDSLREIRKSRGITQTNVAEYLGITVVTVTRYERKARKIPYEVLQRYAGYLGYEIGLLKRQH